MPTAKQKSVRHSYRRNPSEILSGKSIETQYLPATNFKGSRIKASVIDGNRIQKSITLGYNHALNGDENHLAAAIAMRDKMGWDGDLIGTGTRKGYSFGFKSFVSARRNPSRKRGKPTEREMRALKRAEHEHYSRPSVNIDIDVDSHNAKRGSKTRVNPIKGKKSIRLQKRSEGVWVTIAEFEHTRENLRFAKQMGKRYHRKYPEYALRII